MNAQDRAELVYVLWAAPVLFTVVSILLSL